MPDEASQGGIFRSPFTFIDRAVDSYVGSVLASAIFAAFIVMIIVSSFSEPVGPISLLALFIWLCCLRDRWKNIRRIHANRRAQVHPDSKAVTMDFEMNTHVLHMVEAIVTVTEREGEPARVVLTLLGDGDPRAVIAKQAIMLTEDRGYQVRAEVVDEVDSV